MCKKDKMELEEKKQLEFEVKNIIVPNAIENREKEIIEMIENETNEYKQFIHYDIIKKWKDKIIKKINRNIKKS